MKKESRTSKMEAEVRLRIVPVRAITIFEGTAIKVCEGIGV